MSVVSQSNIASESDFLSDLIALMKTSEFRSFQQKHMLNATESKTAFIYFELYSAIEEVYTKIMGEPMPDEFGKEILRTIMQKRNYRKPLIGSIVSYMENSSSRDDLREKIESILTRGQWRELEN